VKTFEPRPYQDIAIQHLVEKTDGAALWADMGLGKTVSTLTALSEMFDRADARRVLVVAPPRVARETWPAEIQKWGHLSHLGCADLSSDGWQENVRNGAQVHVTNYERLISRTITRNGQTKHYPGLLELSKPWPYDVVVFDESSMIKNHNSKRVRALRKVRSKIDNVIELTGTPAPNGLHDLWSQAFMLDGGERLGRTLTAFRDRWFETDFTGFNYIPKEHAQKEIEARMSDIALTLRADDWFDVNKPVVVPRPVQLPDKVMDMYRDLERRMFLEYDEAEATAVNAAALSSKCMQLTNGSLIMDEGKVKEVHDLKLQALDEIIQEANGDPVIVAYSYRKDRDRILKAFKQAVPVESKDAVARWNRGEIPILVMHPASAGHGLNLQDGGRRMVWFGPTWNLEHYEQAIERIGPVRQHQSGYDRAVFIYHIFAQDTIDVEVMERLEGKRDVQNALKAAMARRA